MPRYTVDQLIASVPDTGGIYSAIAQNAGCSWHTVDTRAKASSRLRQAIEEERQRVLDWAESVIVSSIIDDRDVSVAKWFLRLKGRERGYMEHVAQELTGKDGGPVALVIVERIIDGGTIAGNDRPTPDTEGVS